MITLCKQYTFTANCLTMCSQNQELDDVATSRNTVNKLERIIGNSFEGTCYYNIVVSTSFFSMIVS